jgi:hypothetical protein
LQYDLVLLDTSYGDPGLLDIQGTTDAAMIRGAPGSLGGRVDANPQIPPALVDTQAILLNLQALDAHDTAPRYHAAYVPAQATWPGGALYRSTDGSASFQQLDTAFLRAITGIVASAPGAGTTHAVDTGTTIRVVLDSPTMELTTINDAALAAGQNLAALGSNTYGWEILAFRTATLVSAGTYDLTHLLRGRRGTEYLQGAHHSNDRFVLLDSAARPIPMALPERGVSVPYKALTIGQNLADISSFTFTPTAENMLPWSAASVAASLTGTGSWQITWCYRPRFGGDWVDGLGSGYDPDFLGFDVVIYSSNTYATVKRTITTDGGHPLDPTASKGCLYTSSQQVTDFGSAQSTLYYKVFQKTNVGRGYAAPMVAP